MSIGEKYMVIQVSDHLRYMHYITDKMLEAHHGGYDMNAVAEIIHDKLDNETLPTYMNSYRRNGQWWLWKWATDKMNSMQTSRGRLGIRKHHVVPVNTNTNRVHRRFSIEFPVYDQ
ncbi:hypothetical protein EhVM1_000202 [Emiliania huxleyi virus M1]|nr:hypothetical protein EhVM1_000202 [Emiliania huxleyi virus M1]